MSGQTVNFTYKLDEDDWAHLTQKLDELAGDKARVYMARALNKTATTARVKLVKKAQESYTVKSGGFKKDMRITKASAGNLVATLHSNGDTLSIPKFKYSFSRPNPVRVDIVKTGLKDLYKYGNKAFVGKGRLHGNVYVRTGQAAKRYQGVSRSEYKRRTGREVSASREGLEKLKSKSVPYMLGSENRVWGPMRPQIGNDLQKYMKQQIALLMG